MPFAHSVPDSTRMLTFRHHHVMDVMNIWDIIDIMSSRGVTYNFGHLRIVALTVLRLVLGNYFLACKMHVYIYWNMFI